MAVELDHLFIATTAGAPEADRLIEFGLSEGSSNRHPGQGTANRRFFFRNVFLELLWVEDPGEAQSSLVRRTGLWERWARRSGDVSPFGLAFRPAPGGETGAPFPIWEYRPPYLPTPLAIHMGCNSEVVAEPLLFYLPFGRRAEARDAAGQPRSHPAGIREITRVRVALSPGIVPSAELRAAMRECEGLTFESGSENLLEVGFDHETAGRSADFRPALPMILVW